MEKEIEIPVLIEEGESRDLLPFYATDGASGADIRARLKEPLIISPGKSALIPTGLKFEIPSGYEIQVRPRSGLALKNQVTVLNTPGTIDADYRGEVGVILINHGTTDFIVERGMRIAQIVVAETIKARFFLAERLEETARGISGFGTTGVN